MTKKRIKHISKLNPENYKSRIKGDKNYKTFIYLADIKFTYLRNFRQLKALILPAFTASDILLDFLFSFRFVFYFAFILIKSVYILLNAMIDVILFRST